MMFREKSICKKTYLSKNERDNYVIGGYIDLNIMSAKSI